jgi:hypothetical protein
MSYKTNKTTATVCIIYGISKSYNELQCHYKAIIDELQH